MQNSSIRFTANEQEQFPISCVCKSLYSYKKCSTSEKICHLGCVNFDLTRATDKEEYHWFLHVSKRKGSDVNSKVSSAIVLIAGWLENDHIKLSCYPVMDPDSMMSFSGVDTPKGKVDGSSVPLQAQNLASFNNNSARSELQLQDRCNLWLTGSANADSPMQNPKKLCRSSRATNSLYSPVKRNGKRLLRSKRISRQYSVTPGNKCQEISDINLSDSYPNALESQLFTDQNSTKPVILENTAQLPWELSVDEFLDFIDTEDEFEMQSCIGESDEPLFVDFPAQEEKCCEVHGPVLQPTSETTSTTLNYSDIVDINSLDQLLTEVVPSCTTKKECQVMQSKINSHGSAFGERCQIETPKLSDSQQNHEPASKDTKHRSRFSIQNNFSECTISLNSNSKISNSTSEESQTASIEKNEKTIPYLLKKCNPHTDLSLTVYAFNSTVACETREHPSVEISVINSLLNEELSKHLCSKKSDDPLIKTCKSATNSAHDSRLGTSQCFVKHSGALCPSENSFNSSMVRPLSVVGRNKSSSGTSISVIPSKERDSLSKVSNLVVEPCSVKVSGNQKYRTLDMKSEMSFENVETSNLQQPNGLEHEQIAKSYPQITTSISDSRCNEANIVKQSNFKLISSDASQSLQGPLTADIMVNANVNLSDACENSNSKEQSTSSGKNSTWNVIENYSGAIENQNTIEDIIIVPKSVEETNKLIPDNITMQTRSSSLTGTSMRKVQSRTYDPLGPSDPLVWSRRVRLVSRKLRVARLLNKPNKM